MSLRQAAQQALEALIPLANAASPNERECLTDEDHERAAEALEALCAALAEPDSDYERGFVDGMNLQTKGSVDKAVNRMAQTTHWEGCEAVHPECKTEHEVKDLSNYEFKTYKTGGAELEAGFYSTDELRDLVKALDKMNAATERSMKRMK